MAHFQWYIIGLEEGSVVGTNDVQETEKFIHNDEYLILSGQHGVFYLGSRKENEVKELQSYDSDMDDDGED